MDQISYWKLVFDRNSWKQKTIMITLKCDETHVCSKNCVIDRRINPLQKNELHHLI